jgi:hypothetical protein
MKVGIARAAARTRLLRCSGEQKTLADGCGDVTDLEAAWVGGVEDRRAQRGDAGGAGGASRAAHGGPRRDGASRLQHHRRHRAEAAYGRRKERYCFGSAVSANRRTTADADARALATATLLS